MKRILFILTALVVSITSYAITLTGKTYKGSFKYNGATITVTCEFTTAEYGVQTFTITQNGKQAANQSVRFVYVVDGDEVLTKDENGDEGGLGIRNGNLEFASAWSPDLIVLKPVGTSSGSKSKGKVSSKKRR